MYDHHSTYEATEQLIGMPVAEVEHDLILATLRRMDGNRTQASKVLGISIRTLRNKLRAYALDGADIAGPTEP